jgi:hypothetical protein
MAKVVDFAASVIAIAELIVQVINYTKRKTPMKTFGNSTER